MHFKRFAHFAVFAALALPAVAQAQAGPVRYGAYYDETISGSCSSAAVSCAGSFSALPSDKMTTIQRIHCNFTSNVPMARARFGVSTTSGGAALPREIALPLSIANTMHINGSWYAATDTDTQWLVGQGRFPFAEIFTNQSSVSGFTCTLIGTLSDPIPGQ
ncbi:hypothetical protein [Bradyrhizobium sp.]|jgi:hypothetical protein|uniref:hypothetical protein n=1 Tax=Bradyrhizobium sp. TaxID=376 RepID=UPI002DDD5F40|nr:hypothetical protein [Bradyrhizobium sp.]HEV2160264.1 hypothetical protein [Bradyrhizobium sp.]